MYALREGSALNSEKKEKLALIAGGVLCLVAASVLLHAFKGRFGSDTAGVVTVDLRAGASESTAAVSPEEEPHGEAEGEKACARQGQSEWMVYVTGAVARPGIYRLPAGARAYQALEAAGGFSDSAAREEINLAAVLADGVHVKFPKEGQKGGITASRGSAGSGPAHSEANPPPVNINTASAKELEELPGIGPKTSEAIISFRERNGGFQQKTDIMDVKGIGPKKYDAISGRICVD